MLEPLTAKLGFRGVARAGSKSQPWCSAPFLSLGWWMNHAEPSQDKLQGSRPPSAPCCQVIGRKEGFSQQAPSLACCLSPDAPCCCSSLNTRCKAADLHLAAPSSFTAPAPVLMGKFLAWPHPEKRPEQKLDQGSDQSQALLPPLLGSPCGD